MKGHYKCIYITAAASSCILTLQMYQFFFFLVPLVGNEKTKTKKIGGNIEQLPFQLISPGDFGGYFFGCVEEVEIWFLV